MTRAKPAAGQRFGRLLAIEDLPGSRARCVCDCGNETIVLRGNLRNRGTKSCGCATGDANRERLTTHGMRRSSTWTCWQHMKRRCLNHSDPKFARYGGRGITVCQRWVESFEAFRADVGDRPSSAHSIDRINNDGNYEPGNVRWATKREQAQNTSSTRRLTHNGETLCVSEWSRRVGLRPMTIARRIDAGWSIERALGEPSRERPRGEV